MTEYLYFHLALIVGLFFNPAAALFFTRIGDILPSNPYVFTGDTLNLTCAVSDPKLQGNLSGSLFFTKMFGKEERPLPGEYTKILNSRSIQLAYPVRSGEDQGGYTCLMNKTSEKPKIISNQYVRVEHRPSVIKNLTTVVDDWGSMTVTWDLGQQYINPNLVQSQLVWTLNPTDNDVYKCPHATPTSCVWEDNDERDTFKNLPYYMSVIVRTIKDGRTGEETAHAASDWFPVDTQLFVKPAPVQNLSVVERNTSCISLSWELSDNSRMRTISHTVLVIQESLVQQSISTEDTYISVCGLTPGTDYTFNISCIPVPIGQEAPRGYYSDWRVVQGRTLDEVSLTTDATTFAWTTDQSRDGDTTTTRPTQSQSVTTPMPHTTLNDPSTTPANRKTSIGVDKAQQDLQEKMLLTKLIEVIDKKETMCGNSNRLVVDHVRLITDVERLVLDRERLVLDRKILVLDRERLVLDRKRLVLDRERLVLDRASLVKERERLVRDQKRLVEDRELLVRVQKRLVDKELVRKRK